MLCLLQQNYSRSHVAFKFNIHWFHLNFSWLSGWKKYAVTTTYKQPENHCMNSVSTSSINDFVSVILQTCDVQKQKNFKHSYNWLHLQHTAVIGHYHRHWKERTMTVHLRPQVDQPSVKDRNIFKLKLTICWVLQHAESQKLTFWGVTATIISECLWNVSQFLQDYTITEDGRLHTCHCENLKNLPLFIIFNRHRHCLFYMQL
jgi:hypothetical protein